MKFLCWLIDHDWGTTIEGIRCNRCRVEPYDDTTMPEWFRNTRIEQRVRRFANRVRLYAKSRKCWTPGHDWSPASCYCQRCGMSGTEEAERGEWMLPEWRKLWRAWLSDRFGLVAKPYNGTRFAVRAFHWRLGVERSELTIKSERYMTRYIAYLGPIELRLHKFYSGDEDSAPHTHPWSFITFPFHSYVERLYKEGVFLEERVVKKLRFHFRGPNFEHIVRGPMWTWGLYDLYWNGIPLHSTEPGFEPFWTFVITGPRIEDWGFYPQPGKFVFWQNYKPGERTGAKTT